MREHNMTTGRCVGRALGALMLMLMALPLSAGVSVESVRIWPAPDHTRLVLDVGDAIEHRVFALTGPARLVIDLKNSQLNSNFDRLDLSGSRIKRILSAELTADSHFQLAMIAIRKEAFPEARSHLEKLAAGKLPESGPKPDAVFYYLGHAQLKAEDWPAAAQSFARGIREFPDSTWRETMLYELAWC